MTTLEMWGFVVGAAMPAIIAFLNRSQFSGPMRAVVAFVACVIAAGVTAYLNGQFDVQDVIPTIIRVFFTAIGTYQAVWRPSGIAARIEGKSTVTAVQST